MRRSVFRGLLFELLAHVSLSLLAAIFQPPTVAGDAGHTPTDAEVAQADERASRRNSAQKIARQTYRLRQERLSIRKSRAGGAPHRPAPRAHADLKTE